MPETIEIVNRHLPQSMDRNENANDIANLSDLNDSPENENEPDFDSVMKQCLDDFFRSDSESSDSDKSE